MKRKISILLAMLLTLSTFTDVAAAEDAVTKNEEVAEKTGVLELSIEDAIKLATESDRQMWEIDNGIKQAKDERRQGKNAKEQAEESMSFGTVPTDQYVVAILQKNDYYTKLADNKITQLEKSKDVLTKRIEMETKSLYYNVLLAEKKIEINQAKLSRADEQLRVVNLKFDNGSATKAEVLNGEMAVQQAKSDLDSEMDDLDTAKLDLLNRLDLPFDKEIVLTETELAYVPTEKLDLDEAIEKAKSDRPEILEAHNKLELQEIETHANTAYYTSNLWQYKVAVKRLEDAKLDVPQTYKDVELDVRKSYLNLVKTERALINIDKTVELAKEAARVKKLLYENGMATSFDVLDANTSLAESEKVHYELLVNYSLSKFLFDNSNLMGAQASK